ncbi:40S ribosomal protein S17 [Heracleum sosnowskyi]|uniref:40S ribosomal protein S17 n=1 Tax=Heracleum sosnowskyi TaxID=360622 RepID=A0AAD8MYD3_9APIA|nr:40S ribosomal protein S17 [Heracleum sosnowskyi]
MGRVRTKTVKKSSRQVIEKYYSKMTLDFHTNKKILEEVAIIPSKRLRNKIAGFSTHLMKRIQKGPVRGISLKLQEEERERRMDFVPDESAIRTDRIEVDKETIDLLASLGMSELPGIFLKEEQAPVAAMPYPAAAAGRGGFGGGARSRHSLFSVAAALTAPALLESPSEQQFCNA